MPDTRTRYLADESRLHCVMPQTERKTLNLLNMDFHARKHVRNLDAA